MASIRGYTCKKEPFPFVGGYKMKKFLIHTGLVITFIIIYFLQSIFFSEFTIAGIMPNLFIILMLYIGLYMGRTEGIIYGIIFGIFLDLWIGKTLGLTSIALALIGVISGILDKTFSKDSRLIVLLMGVVCTIIYEVALYIMQYMVLSINIEILQFIQILLIEVFYNVIIISILYPLMKVTGYEIENEIKGDKILTRYF